MAFIISVLDNVILDSGFVFIFESEISLLTWLNHSLSKCSSFTSEKLFLKCCPKQFAMSCISRESRYISLCFIPFISDFCLFLPKILLIDFQ